MFIWIYIFRWVLNAKAPFLMPIFHGDRWLHLLVFIWERTTKNLQLLQTRVTRTLSCVWLWCTSTFLVEEMKGDQAAESTVQDQLPWGAPTSRSLRYPSSFPERWSLRCSPLWLGPRSQQAIKVVPCFTHSQTRALNVSLLTQGRARQGIHWSAATYASNWLTWTEAQHQEDIREGCRNLVVTPWLIT